MRNPQMARQLRKIDLRKPCIACNEPVNAKGQTVPHGWMHANCEQEVSRDVGPLVARLPRMANPEHVESLAQEIRRVTDRLNGSVEGVPADALVTVDF